MSELERTFAMLNRFKTTVYLASVALVVALACATQAQESTGRSTWTWNQSDDGRKIEVKVENKVEFNEDYSDVAAIPSDGALRIYDSRGEPKFRLVVTRGPGGELRRDYSVDGQSRTFDAQGRALRGEVLLQTRRHGVVD